MGMGFWETVAGHNLAEMMQVFFGKQMHKHQYTKVVENKHLGSFVEAEIKAGSNFVATVPHDTEHTLVIMENSHSAPY